MHVTGQFRLVSIFVKLLWSSRSFVYIRIEFEKGTINSWSPQDFIPRVIGRIDLLQVWAL